MTKKIHQHRVYYFIIRLLNFMLLYYFVIHHKWKVVWYVYILHIFFRDIL